MQFAAHAQASPHRRVRLWRLPRRRRRRRPTRRPRAACSYGASLLWVTEAVLTRHRSAAAAARAAENSTHFFVKPEVHGRNGGDRNRCGEKKRFHSEKKGFTATCLLEDLGLEPHCNNVVDTRPLSARIRRLGDEPDGRARKSRRWLDKVDIIARSVVVGARACAAGRVERLLGRRDERALGLGRARAPRH